MIKKILKWALVAIVLIAIAYVLGPQPRYRAIDPSPITFDIPLESIDDYIADKESEVADLKPGNEAKIVWADSTKTKKEFALVYLHGFSASREEGAPLHIDFATRYGMNLYLSRLFDHGRTSQDAFKQLLPEDLINSAKEAIAIGRLIGEKVVVMSCSTGGTFSAILAPHDADIHSLIMFSPNIDLYDPSSALVVKPWGRQLLKLVMGGEHNHVSYTDEAKKYWSEAYHTDGIIALKYLIDQEMNEANFSKIDVPLYMGYYYEDEEHQDQVVSVDRMLEFYNQIGTPDEMKREETLNNAQRHVMTSYIFNKDMTPVKESAYKFAEEILNFKPVDKALNISTVGD